MRQSSAPATRPPSLPPLGCTPNHTQSQGCRMKEGRLNGVGGGGGGGRMEREGAYPVHRVSALPVLQCKHPQSYIPQTSSERRESPHDEQYCRDMSNRLAHFNHLLPVLGWVHGRFCQQYLQLRATLTPATLPPSTHTHTHTHTHTPLCFWCRG